MPCRFYFFGLLICFRSKLVRMVKYELDSSNVDAEATVTADVASQGTNGRKILRSRYLAMKNLINGISIFRFPISSSSLFSTCSIYGLSVFLTLEITN